MFWWYQLLKETKNIYAILFWISLMMINPFFYGRIVDGQVNVYLASAGMILYVALLKWFFEKPNFKKAIFAGLFSLFLTLTTIHTAYFIALACCVFFMVYSIGSNQRWKIIKYGIILGIVTIGVNVFWAGPIVKGYFIHKTESIITTERLSPTINNGVVNLSDFIESFWDIQRKAFETTPWTYGVYANVLMMKGYWGERVKARFLPSQGINQQYAILMILMGGIILLGIWTHIFSRTAQERLSNYTMLILWCCGFILSLWISQNNIFTPVNTLLYDHLPLYTWFRDPQKWSIFLIIAYGYFGWYGVKKIYDSIQGLRSKTFIMIAILVLPILYTPNMLLWFNQQLIVKHFPPEWIEMRDYLQENVTITSQCENQKVWKSGCYTFLYFPWHGYMSLQWLRKIVYSDIVNNITQHNLVGDNMEMKLIYTQSERKESKIIEHYIAPAWWTLRNKNEEWKKQELIAFKKDISDLGIQYIILLQEADFLFYKSFLDAMVQEGALKKEKENRMIVLYRLQ